MSLTIADLSLAGSYDLSVLGELRSELLRVADAAPGRPVHLDMEQVETADVGFVQLLLSFQASVAARGGMVTAKGSPAVLDLFRRAGAELPGLS